MTIPEVREFAGVHAYDGRLMDLSPEGVTAGLARLRNGPREPDRHDEAHLAATEDGLDATYALAEMHRWNPIVHLENLDLACYDRTYAPAAERAAARAEHLSRWPEAVDASLRALDAVPSPVATGLLGAAAGLVTGVHDDKALAAHARFCERLQHAAEHGPPDAALGSAVLARLLGDGDAMAVDLGRLEDTMYLSMFAMEEAKHTDMFRRWFDAVGLDPASLDDLVREQRAALGQRRVGLFDGALTKVMRRLDTDKSPQAILDATLIYNQLVEGVAAIAGYRRWDETFRRIGKLPGLQAGLKLTQRDERRHIAYGTYLGRRVIAENPELWEWLERRWEKLTAGFGAGYGAAADESRDEQAAAAGIDREYHQVLIKRRLEALAVARTMMADEVMTSPVETFEPEELQHVN
jgi:hypothetical protein